KVDADSVVALATRIDQAVVKAPATKPPPDDKTKTTEAPPNAPEWAYLGCIKEATRNVAMIAVEGRQKFLPEGRTFGATKLVSVAEDKITVETAGHPRTIARAERDPSKSSAWVRNMANNAPPPNQAAVTGIAPGGAGAQLTPEIRARLAERGMSPDQIAQWRNRRNGDQGGGRGPVGVPGRGGSGGDQM